MSRSCSDYQFIKERNYDVLNQSIANSQSKRLLHRESTAPIVSLANDRSRSVLCLFHELSYDMSDFENFLCFSSAMARTLKVQTIKQYRP